MRKINSLIICFFLFVMFLYSSCYCFAHDGMDSHVFARPLIVEYQEGSEIQSTDYFEELRLQCTSWRFAVEANNLGPWKSIPIECIDYVKDYMTGRAYVVDLETVSNEAASFAKSVELGEDGMDVWVFDVDETLLSNFPYYVEHGYGYDHHSSVFFHSLSLR